MLKDTQRLKLPLCISRALTFFGRGFQCPKSGQECLQKEGDMLKCDLTCRFCAHSEALVRVRTIWRLCSRPSWTCSTEAAPLQVRIILCIECALVFTPTCLAALSVHCLDDNAVMARQRVSKSNNPIAMLFCQRSMKRKRPQCGAGGADSIAVISSQHVQRPQGSH